MTAVVIDASAGVELVADTRRGRDLRAPLPEQAVPWVPELFYVECGAVLRRWDLNRVLPEADIARAVDELLAWPLRVAAVRPLLREAWRRRATVSVPDAVYLALSQALGAPLLTDDHKLANAPKLGVEVLRLSATG